MKIKEIIATLVTILNTGALRADINDDMDGIKLTWFPDYKVVKEDNRTQQIEGFKIEGQINLESLYTSYDTMGYIKLIGREMLTQVQNDPNTRK